MASCKYCGEFSGLLKGYHDECRLQYERAVKAIPAFFLKIIDSEISAQRFAVLLVSAAKSSRVPIVELKRLCEEGIQNVISSKLLVRPLTILEMQRITDAADALEAEIADKLSVNELLVKNTILSEIWDGRTPSYISLISPLPVELARNESVLWIYNSTAAWPISAEEKSTFSQASLPVEFQGYISPNVRSEVKSIGPFPNRPWIGDLIISSRNGYFIQGNKTRLRIPIARISSVRLYANGIRIESPIERLSRFFLIDDPWLAANVVGFLAQNFRGQPKQGN